MQEVLRRMRKILSLTGSAKNGSFKEAIRCRTCVSVQMYTRPSNHEHWSKFRCGPARRKMAAEDENKKLKTVMYNAMQMYKQIRQYMSSHVLAHIDLMCAGFAARRFWRKDMEWSAECVTF